MVTLVLAPAVQATPQKVRLLANVLPGLDRLTDAGAPGAGDVLHLGIGLRRPDPAGEEQLLRELYDPTSPAYQRFLTPAEFAQQFGVERARFDGLLGWLRRGGLTITQQGSSRDYVQAVGTVRGVERLFATRLRLFALHDQRFVANVVAPSVPAALGVESVVGLNTFQRFHLPERQGAAAAAPNTGLMTARDLWKAYEQPSDNLGEGETMAVFGYGPADEVIHDLRTFEKNNDLPPVPVLVKQVGAGPFNDASGAVEWNLDTQASLGMAPHVQREDLYFTKSLLDPDVAAAFSQWVSDPDGPRQADASFGECETDPANFLLGNHALQPDRPPTQQLGNNLQPVGEAILRQAVVEGRTLFASTGDTGSSCPVLVLPGVGAGNGVLNQVVPFIGYPAASRYAVAVGGTVLYTQGPGNGVRALERGWEFGGGGTSAFITAPEFQRGVPNLIGRCLVDSSGQPTNTGQLCRGIPDVAAISGDVAGNGYDIVVHGQPGFAGGGTSLSAPLWVGMWARVQAASPAPKGLGFANPAFYRLGKDPAAYASSFYDVTAGTNGLFLAGKGWDYVTGWGTPRLAGLMRALDGKTAPTRNILPPPLPPTPAVKPACAQSWLDDVGDDVFNYDVRGPGKNPQLDIVESRIALRPDRTLRATLVLNDLSTSVPVPGAANDYFVTWKFGKTTYFAKAEAVLGGAVSFGDGVVSGGNFDQRSTVSGRFTPGRRGTIDIYVPVTDVGDVHDGSVLTQPTGRTAVLVGTPAAGLVETVDVAGPDNDHRLSAACPSN